MNLSRRNFIRMSGSAGALATLGVLGRGAAFGSSVDGFRAMVGVFLFGGNDGWNMVVPTDGPTHAAYTGSRGTLALPMSVLAPLSGSNFALHGAMSKLTGLWDSGAMNVVLNTGTLFAPMDKATYFSRPDLRPSNLMSHSDEQAHWQGLRAQTTNRDGFMGRVADRAQSASIPSTISFAGNNIALIGNRSQPLVLPVGGVLTPKATGNGSIEAAVSSFDSGAGLGFVTEQTAQSLKDAYQMTAATASVLKGASSVDAHFVDPDNGKALTSDVAQQLKSVARMIEARNTFGHSRQSFLVSQGGYDTHDGQLTSGAPQTGTHAALLGDLALALYAFQSAMRSLGLGGNVTTFTMSDFGRTYMGNAQYGSDHAWGSNHLVISDALAPKQVIGRYPDPTLGGSDDVSREGRFVPGIAQEEYLGAIAKWHGVGEGDLSYVIPNWNTWRGRGTLPLYNSIYA